MEEFAIGDFVKINDQDSIAEVISIRGNNIEVAVGLMKMVVKKNKVSLTQPPPVSTFESQQHNEQPSASIDIKEKLMNFQFELDVRGKMKDEVMVQLASWVDDAILLGIAEARILHGRGSGVIKDTVRATLRKYKEIESLADAGQFQGGEFVTLVKFRK